MASRRMFSLAVCDTDDFLEMPLTSQALYFHLGLHADDDGFVSAPKKILRMIGCKDDDLQSLVLKKYVIQFDSGVLVITNWKENNYLRPDRYKPTRFQNEYSLLSEKDGIYYLSDDGIPDGSQLVDSRYTQDRLGKNRLGKDRLGKSNSAQAHGGAVFLLDELLPKYDFSSIMEESLRSWVEYKQEKHDPYKERGLKSLLTTTQKYILEYGESAIYNLIEESIGNGYKGISWDRLKNNNQKSMSDRISNRISEVDDW